MRKFGLGLCLMLGAAMPAFAQLSILFNTPGVSIGINVPVYPTLVRIPGYPVYYAPSQRANLFFYDGLYWVLQGDNWYASSWYDGPWGLVQPDAVPLFILRVPVRYYRAPPPYFRGWRSDAPPQWGTHWGPSWERDHRDWYRWDRNSEPAPAPLPSYQRSYSGNRYPRAEEQQRALREQHYRYQSREGAPARPEPRPESRPQPVPAPQPARPGPGGAMQPGSRPGPAPAQREPQARPQAPNERAQQGRGAPPVSPPAAQGRDKKDNKDNKDERGNRDNRGGRPGERGPDR